MSGMSTFGPADIERATAGAITSNDLRQWNHFGMFNTPMAEPRAGKPRQYPLRAVHEAVLLRAFVAQGVTLAKAKRWNAQILDAIDRKGVAHVNVKGQPSGPDGFGAPQIVLFDAAKDEPRILSDSEAGETINKAFYMFSGGTGPAKGLGAIHLPAIISEINRALGVGD